jgi:hypothetical protein
MLQGWLVIRYQMKGYAVMLYDMYVKRSDGSRYLAATVNADSTAQALELFKPDYGFGVLAITRKQSTARGLIHISKINPNALQESE